MSAKKIAKKKAKPAAKKRAKHVPKKAAELARKGRLPREEEEVPGYTPGLPDLQKWPEIANLLKVRPFYTGKDAVPFSRLRARGFNDPADMRHPMKNEFFLVRRAVR